MAASPIVEVQIGAGPFVGTTNGVNSTPGAVVSIRLLSTTDVTNWFLQVVGTDELSTVPALTGVNNLTNEVTSPSTVVTFTFPNAPGRAIRFQSTVQGVGGPLSTTFGVFSPTGIGQRVGAAGQKREGNATYGWITLLNPIIRDGASAIAYDDSLQSPTLGVSTVQAALDALKVTGTPELPPLANVQYAFLMEDPAGTLVFQRATEDMILPGFSIASFAKSAPNGGQLTYRRGDTITGITANASYVGGPPTSASIARVFGGSTDPGDVDPGVWTISSPFSTGSLAGSVKRNGADLGGDPSMTSTLTATKGVIRTASFTVSWTRDVYWGVGLAGLSTEADIEGLANTALSSTRNRTLSLNPLNQKVYYAYPVQYGTATFTLNGFPFAMNPPTTVSVTNVNGVVSSYYLYESTNLLTNPGPGNLNIIAA
jgi:hypothetical protein